MSIPKKTPTASKKVTAKKEEPEIIYENSYPEEPKRKPYLLYVIGGLILIIGVLLYFTLRKDPPPPPVAPDQSVARSEMDSTKAALRELTEWKAREAEEKINEGDKKYKQPIINNHYYAKSKEKFDAIKPRIDTSGKSELRRLFAKP